MTTTPSSTSSQPRTPVYFLSIGGPNFIENVKPRAVVVLSAHWQAETTTGNRKSKIQVNAAEDAGIMYDFYGFPPHYYEVGYPYRGDPKLAGRVVDLLEESGAVDQVEMVKRGLDHRVWVGFRAGGLTCLQAFHPEKNPLNVPIVQVSLFDNEDVDQHYRLGQALAPLRDEGVVIICSGMSVHNLNNYRRQLRLIGGSSNKNEPLPYVLSFDEALQEAVTSLSITAEGGTAEGGKGRAANMVALMRREDARQAHPTWDHILPMHVAAGAAGDEEPGQRLWNFPERCISWAQYRFGRVEEAVVSS